MDAEALRDAIFVAAGGLNRTVGGPSVPVHIGNDRPGGGLHPAEDGPIDGLGRRSIYIKTRRNFPDALLAVFDKPAPAAPFGRRNTSNVPAQALALLNDPFVIQQAQSWAKRVLGIAKTRDARVEELFRDALARRPTTEELAGAADFLGSSEEVQTWSDYAHTLFNLKEFLYVP
jgi:hypothetical protein